MKKKNSFLLKVIGVTLLGLVFILGLSGCNNETTNADGTITITIFDQNTLASNFGDDRIAQRILEETGVNIQVYNSTGDAQQLLSLMLASGDLPDIVFLDRRTDLIARFSEAGVLVPLNDLIDNYMPNVAEMYAGILQQDTWIDGNNYVLANWYGQHDSPSTAVLMRMDYLTEIVGEERATSAEPFTQTELIEILHQFRQNHPEVNGLPTIGMMMFQINGLDQNHAIEGMFGLRTFYNMNNGDLGWRMRDPQYLEMMKFLNELNRESLLDPEWVSTSWDTVDQGLSQGHVFGAFVGSYGQALVANTVLAQTVGPEAQFMPFKVLGNNVGPDDTTFGGRGTMGWDAAGITTSADPSNHEAIARVIDFLASREGQTLMLWGIEGEDFTITENGAFIPTQEVLDAFAANFEQARAETGIGRWNWFVNQQGPNPYTPFRMHDYATFNTPLSTMARQNLVNTMWDTSVYQGLLPEGNTMLGMRTQQIIDIFLAAIPRMVMASSQEELIEIYNETIDAMETAGLQEVEEVLNQNWHQRRVLWGLE